MGKSCCLPVFPALLEMEAGGSPEGSLASAVASVLGLLLGFAAILVAAYWAAKIAGGKLGSSFKGAVRGQPGPVEILGRTPIGQDRFLLVVRAGGKVLLLGATPQNIQTLCELDPEGFPETPLPDGAGNGKPVGFAEALEEMKKKYAGFADRKDSGQKEERDGKS